MRPQKIYQAFIDSGHDVILLKCQQNKRKERKKAVSDILEFIKKNSPDICYIESPSGPIFNSIDLKLIRTIHKKGVPIGLFYRDAFWLFKEKKDKRQYLKEFIIDLLNIREVLTINKTVDILYMPSQTMIDIISKKKLFKVKVLKALPPASNRYIDVVEKNEKSGLYRGIYVGGLSHAYGSDILIEAFSALNKKNNVCKLTIVCREEDYRKYKERFTDRQDWLTISHASGSSLDELYYNADFGLIPTRRSEYSDMAISVKLMEYIEYGLPVICTDLTEMGRFVEEKNIGITCHDNAPSFAEAVNYYICHKDLHYQYKKNVKDINNKNLWINRVEKIVRDLNDCI